MAYTQDMLRFNFLTAFIEFSVYRPQKSSFPRNMKIFVETTLAQQGTCKVCTTLYRCLNVATTL